MPQQRTKRAQVEPFRVGPDPVVTIIRSDTAHKGREIPKVAIGRASVFAVRTKSHFVPVTGKADIVWKAESDRQITLH